MKTIARTGMTQRIVAVDTGLRHCGVSFMVDGELREARLVSNTVPVNVRDARAWGAMASEIAAFVWDKTPDLVILEYPQTYKGTAHKSEVDEEDLRQLRGVIASFQKLRVAKVHVIYPHDWKHSVPKPLMLKRIEKCLTPEEQQRVLPAGDLTHNILDAVGINLWFSKRLR